MTASLKLQITKSIVKDLKRELNTQIRAYFLSHAVKNEDGLYYCPLKRKFFQEQDMQVAHFIDRNKSATVYYKDNLLLCSKQSNVWDAKVPIEGYKSKHHKDYEEYIGQCKADYLRKLSENRVSYNRQDLTDLIKMYKNNINSKT